MMESLLISTCSNVFPQKHQFLIKTFFSSLEDTCKRWFAVVFNHKKILARLSIDTS